LLLTPSSAKIYKYKKNGTWYYTDTPPQDMPTDSRQIESDGPWPKSADNDSRSLLEGFSAANAIEQAAAGTVFIETALGSGSGFFISQRCHIITNKHVIRASYQTFRKTETKISQAEARIAETEAQFDNEKRRLQTYENRLEALKQQAESESRPAVKQNYASEHAQRQEYYLQWQEDFQRRIKKFKAKKKEFESKRAGYNYSMSFELKIHVRKRLA
jgi:serine protease Do